MKNETLYIVGGLALLYFLSKANTGVASTQASMTSNTLTANTTAADTNAIASAVQAAVNAIQQVAS